MTPSQHYRYTFSRYVTSLAAKCGCAYMRPDYHTTALTICAWSVAFAADFCVIYTMCVSDFETALMCSAVLPVGLQGAGKFYITHKTAHLMRGAAETMIEVFRQAEKHRREEATLKKWQRSIDMMMSSFTIVMLLNVISFAFTPLYQWVMDGILECPLPIAVPFVGTHTLIGFCVTLVFQISIISLTAAGTIFYDLSIMLLFVGVCMQTDIMILKLHTLSSGLMDGDDALADRSETSAYVHNFVRMHVEYMMLLQSMSDMFYMTFILEIGLDSLAMCLVLYVLTMLTWFPLYMFFMLFIVKALAACMMGTMISIYNDRLYTAVEKFSWYKLSLRDRLKYRLILQRMQHPTLLTCGTIDLNMELFVAVMKNVYTVAMMLNRMSNE